jgi:hypothetical protein
MMFPGLSIFFRNLIRLLFPAKYLGTCNWVVSVWPLCISRTNCQYFSLSHAWVNTRTASRLARSFARPDIWRSVKYPVCTVPDNKVSAL